MNRKKLIDHLRAGRPVNAKLVKEIVAELEKAQRLEEAARPVCEWWNRNRELLIQVSNGGNILYLKGVSVSSNQLDALCREVDRVC